MSGLTPPTLRYSGLVKAIGSPTCTTAYMCYGVVSTRVIILVSTIAKIMSAMAVHPVKGAIIVRPIKILLPEERGRYIAALLSSSRTKYVLLELAPFALLPVAGCHRASPSTTLDKRKHC